MKTEREGEVRIDEGREFQSVGAATLNDLPPIEESLDLGTARRPESEDLSLRDGM